MEVLSTDQAEHILQTSRISKIRILTIASESDIACGLSLVVKDNTGNNIYMRIEADREGEQPVLTFYRKE